MNFNKFKQRVLFFFFKTTNLLIFKNNFISIFVDYVNFKTYIRPINYKNVKNDETLVIYKFYIKYGFNLLLNAFFLKINKKKYKSSNYLFKFIFLLFFKKMHHNFKILKLKNNLHLLQFKNLYFKNRSFLTKPKNIVKNNKLIINLNKNFLKNKTQKYYINFVNAIAWKNVLSGWFIFEPMDWFIGYHIWVVARHDSIEETLENFIFIELKDNYKFSELTLWTYLYHAFTIIYVSFFTKMFRYFKNNFFIKTQKLTGDKHIIKTKNITYYKNNIFSFFHYSYNFLSNWIIPMILFLCSFIFLIYAGNMPFFKLSFGWLVLFMFFYWIVSGFVFFCKKYQYNLWTTAIQRFWQRSLILFWVLEIFLFSIFMYLTLNANAESFYMADNIQFYKTKLFSWRVFIYKLFLVSFLILCLVNFLLLLKFNTFYKNIIILLLLTIIIVYLFWIEFYQFFISTTFYSNIYWNYFNKDKLNNEFFWFVESDEFKTRNINNYVLLLIILKFWHVVFIVLFWFFFILRTLELKDIKYGLVSANIQNLLILYIFSWILMYPWFKYFFRVFLDSPYKWFYVNNRELSIRIIFYEIINFYLTTMRIVFSKILETNFFYKNTNFFYENFSSYVFNGNGFRKDYINNMVLKSVMYKH